MFQTFNMGMGFAALVRPGDEADALRILRRRFPAKVVGRATRGGVVRVPSMRGVAYDAY
jgi:phosphoribosylaminoimidazole (AIR) synthetase